MKRLKFVRAVVWLVGAYLGINTSWLFTMNGPGLTNQGGNPLLPLVVVFVPLAIIDLVQAFKK